MSLFNLLLSLPDYLENGEPPTPPSQVCLTEEEEELYERMKIDLESVGIDDRLRVMVHLTPKEISDLNKKHMADEEKALFLRARADPASVTPAEKNQLFGRMNPDEEDRLCRERTGLPFKDLQTKAMNDANTLTELETTILAYSGDSHPEFPKQRRKPFWFLDLYPEDQELVCQVWESLDHEYEATVVRRAMKRRQDLNSQYTPKQKAERKERNRKILFPSQLAKWVQDILDTKPTRCGFVVFRTDYADGSDEKWKAFRFHEGRARSVHFTSHWKRANNLDYRFKSEYICDPSLEGLDAKGLRSRFNSMRDRGEIPAGIATTCFLVVDEAALNNAIIEGKMFFSAKTADHPDPWYDTFSIRAINADYDASDERGEIILPIPKTFEWLYYYTTFTTDTPWKTLYDIAQEGPAEILETRTPLPLWRYKGKEALNTLVPSYVYGPQRPSSYS